MLKIGITGGIGSGKTTVCQIFELLGIPVFYADTVAKQIMVTDQQLVEEITTAFGSESYFNDGSLNSKHIANIVFNDAVALEQLNRLTHPAVFRAFDQWEKTVPQDVSYTLKEAALLFESGSYKNNVFNVLVKAPLETKLQRVMQRDGATKEQVLARMQKQLSDEQKEPLANFTINNDGAQSLIQQVLALHQQFLEFSKK